MTWKRDDRWYIDLETRLHEQKTIDQPRFQARQRASELNKMAFTLLCENEVAEFLTKTERKESKNTQNILLDGCYPLFEGYLQEQKAAFVS